MTDTAPCREQSDRDRLDDNMADPDHRVGTGPHAVSLVEVLAE